MKKVVSIYVDPAAYSELKQVCRSMGVSVSSKLDELIKEWVREATGKKFLESPIDYEGLKRRHLKLIQELPVGPAMKAETLNGLLLGHFLCLAL